MMEWQPISTYDEMPLKERPRWAAFYFEPVVRTDHRKYSGLPEMIDVERYRGSRVCTLWCPLPPPPKG